ncbi:TetR/AcrR family transcriptional regulator [Yoonia sp. R2-816]|uniref:TetR/AcrR family transcriptional regulator n=1 Tax=Yoonia sp. R2-816 TaxID=3342638 RepID=UPI0037275162
MSDEMQGRVTSRQEARRRKILDEARGLFVEKGFEQTSLDMIIARTGGSRRNIYDLFGNKDGLFEEVMTDQLQTVLARTHVPSAIADDRPVRDQLEQIGLNFLNGLLQPEVLRTLRQFIVASGDRPDLGHRAFAAGPAVLYGQLEGYFEQMVAADRLVLPDVSVAARILTEMFKGGMELRAMMTGDHDIPGSRIEDHVRKAVDLFLNGALPR